MDFEEFIDQIFEPDTPTSKKPQRTAEEITAEFMPIIQADKKRGG